MALKFEEVEKIIRGSLLGGDVSGVYGDGFIIQSDGVLSGREKLLFLLGELKEEYGDVPVKPTVEKRVIELPVDVINDLEKYKKFHVPFSMFIKDVGNGMPYSDYGLCLEDLSDWYLHPEFVEFVQKKEYKFYVEVDRGNDFRYVSFNTNEMVYPVSFTFNKRLMGEIEADKLVAGLTALNARKVKVEDE